MDIGVQEQADFEKGLGIIESRSASLNRFLQAYRQIAQMPGPKLQPTPIRSLLERSAALETAFLCRWSPGPTSPSASTPISWSRC